MAARSSKPATPWRDCYGQLYNRESTALARAVSTLKLTAAGYAIVLDLFARTRGTGRIASGELAGAGHDEWEEARDGYARETVAIASGTIAQNLGLNPVTVRTELRRLELAGIVRVHRRGTKGRPAELGLNLDGDTWQPLPARPAASCQQTWKQRADVILAKSQSPGTYRSLAGLVIANSRSGRVSWRRIVLELFEPLSEIERQGRLCMETAAELLEESFGLVPVKGVRQKAATESDNCRTPLTEQRRGVRQKAADAVVSRRHSLRQETIPSTFGTETSEPRDGSDHPDSLFDPPNDQQEASPCP